MTQTLCLNMIVKDESDIIESTLENVCNSIHIDYYVICDTGSTDGTQLIISEFFSKKNIPGELIQCTWKNFGSNRTEALEHAYNKTDYVMVFDADDRIHGKITLPTLDKDAYFMKIGTPNGFNHSRIFIANNRKQYEYRGVLHEFIDIKGGTTGFIDGDYWIDAQSRGNRSKNPNRFEEDARILENAIKNGIDEDLKSRYTFYCAQSYRDCNQTENAIKWYEERLNMKGFNQELYISCYELAILYLRTKNIDKALHYCLLSIEYDNQRIECILLATQLYRALERHNMVVLLYKSFKDYHSHSLDKKLFVRGPAYKDQLEFEVSVSACYTSERYIGYECCKKLIIGKKICLNFLKVTIHNLQYYVEFMREDKDTLELFHEIQLCIQKYKLYDQKTLKLFDILLKLNIPFIVSHREIPITISSSNPMIMISLNKNKDGKTFSNTVNSILNTWEDVELIDYWFCVDEQSTNIEKSDLLRNYKWMDFHFKNKDEHSLNIIWYKIQQLKPQYWIHIEDDFIFHKKSPYIQMSIQGLTSLHSRNVRQIMFNSNYSKNISEYDANECEKVNDYISLHKYSSDKYGSSNWPHFSFLPCIVDASTILELGPFCCQTEHYEMEYAQKWTHSGYKSGFLDGIHFSTQDA